MPKKQKDRYKAEKRFKELERKKKKEQKIQNKLNNKKSDDDPETQED